MLTIRLHHLFGAALLQPPHVRTPPVQRQQLGMGAAFDDATELHHESLMRVDDGLKPVRDHERNLVACGAPQFFLNRTFVGRIERLCGLVEDQQRRVLQRRARNLDALLFAAQEAPTCRNSWRTSSTRCSKVLPLPAIDSHGQDKEHDQDPSQRTGSPMQRAICVSFELQQFALPVLSR